MASATSRISAQAAAYKPQAPASNADANTGGANEASPFSLVMTEVTAAKPAQSDARGSGKNHRDTDNSAATARNDSTDTRAKPITDAKAASDAQPQDGDDAVADNPQTVIPQAPILLLNPDMGDSDVTASDVPLPKPDVADAATDAPVPGGDVALVTPDMAAQPQLALMVPVLLPVQPSQPAPTIPSGGDAVDGIEDAAPVAASATPPAAQDDAQDAAPMADLQQVTALQTDIPQTDIAQAGVQQTSTPQLVQQAVVQNAATEPAAQADVAQPVPEDQDDAGVPQVAVPAAKPTPTKGAVKPGGPDIKTAKPGADNPVRAPQPDVAPVQPAPPPPAQAAANPAPNPDLMIQPGQAGGATAPPSVPSSVHIQAAPQHSVAPDLNLLAVQIAAKSQNGARQFDIRLDPPELGRVDVRLSIDAAGKTQAHLSADQPQTLDMLQKDATTLTRALRDAGLDVSQSGLNFSLRGQGGNHAQTDMGGGQNGRRGPAMQLQAIKSLDAGAASAAWRGPVDGRLDIRV